MRTGGTSKGHCSELTPVGAVPLRRAGQPADLLPPHRQSLFMKSGLKRLPFGAEYES